MIHFLRRAVKSLPAQILLGLLVISFAVWGIGDVFTAGGPEDVASVGETDVSATEYGDSLVRLRRTLSRQQGRAVPVTELQSSGMANAALAALTRDAAFAEALSHLDIAIPDTAVRSAITDNPAFQDGQGKFSQFLYQSRISQAGYAPHGYERAMRELLGQQVLTNAFTRPAAPLPGVAGKIAAFAGEKRTISYLRLPPETVPAPAAPTDEVLAAWFKEHQEEFRAPERRSGLVLHTNLARLAEESTPTEEEVRAAYDASPAAYSVTPTRTVEQIVFDDMATAKAALARIRDGKATFAEIAAEQNVSIGDLSLGTVTRDQLPDASAKAVFGVTEPGIVGPVEGLFGAMLLNVTAVEQGGTAPFDQVQAQIGKTLATQQAQQLATDRANRINDLRASGTPLPEIAKEIGLDLVTFAGLDPKGSAADDAAPALVSKPAVLAEINAAPEGAERDIIRLDDGSYALVMVEEIADSYLPELDQVHDRAVAAWQAEQRLIALAEHATELAGRITAEGGLAALATAEGLKAPQELSFTREGVPAPVSAALAKAAFTAARGDPLVGRTRDGDAVLLAVLTAIEPLAGDALTTMTGTVEKGLNASLAKDQTAYFGHALETRYGVTRNQAAIERVFNQLGQYGG